MVIKRPLNKKLSSARGRLGSRKTSFPTLATIVDKKMKTRSVRGALGGNEKPEVTIQVARTRNTCKSQDKEKRQANSLKRNKFRSKSKSRKFYSPAYCSPILIFGPENNVLPIFESSLSSPDKSPVERNNKKITSSKTKRGKRKAFEILERELDVVKITEGGVDSGLDRNEALRGFSYACDSADNKFLVKLNNPRKKTKISMDTLEVIIAQFEVIAHTVIQSRITSTQFIKKAKTKLKEDSSIETPNDVVLKEIYSYWNQKRKSEGPLVRKWQQSHYLNNWKL